MIGKKSRKPGRLGRLAGKVLGRAGAGLPPLKRLGAAGATPPSTRDQRFLDKFKKSREKIRQRPKTPLSGKMKKPTGPKPGSMDYFLQETMKPGYKVPKMNQGGRFKSMAEMRKAKGFKPGETPAQFNQRRELAKRAIEAAKANRIGRMVLPIALAGVAGIQYLKSKMKKNEKKAKAKPNKKMSGGLTEATKKLKAQGMVSGGAMCRGMGAAIRGGGFKGVK